MKSSSNLNNRQYAKNTEYFKLQDAELFKQIDGITISSFFPRLSLLMLILVIFFIGALFLPWIQTSHGSGEITALNPEDRMQQIVTPVTGRVNKWFVRDGLHVKKGEKIAEIVDIDPHLLSRLNLDVSTLRERLNAAVETSKLSLSNYNRQQKLYKSGLVSKREVEVAGINYQKALSDEKYYKSQLIKSESLLSKQSSQLIIAPRDGIVINTLASSHTKMVKSGDVIATFLPKTANIAVEIFINGNDVPLVEPGKKVRLVFEGWPSVQFSGWPSVSIGTFGGIVKVVDSAASANGLFRVLIEPDPQDQPWPSQDFLRMRARVQGYIQLNKVLLGYELWRQLNGFPVAINKQENKVTLTNNKTYLDYSKNEKNEYK